VFSNISLELKTNQWLDRSIDWYQEMDLSQPIVFYQNKKELEEIEKNLQALDKELLIEQTEIEIKEIGNDYLVFSTNQLGKPHLIKYTYFPGWQVQGGNGPYLISPSFMMVIPDKEEVILKYSYNFWDKIGFGLSILSLIIFILLVFSLLPF